MPQSQQSPPMNTLVACGAHVAPPYDDARVWPEGSVQLEDVVELVGAGAGLLVGAGVAALDVPHARSLALGG